MQRWTETTISCCRLYEAADIIEKLQLIAQELPEQEFGPARYEKQRTVVEDLPYRIENTFWIRIRKESKLTQR
jgi:hypothetical protein